MIRTLALLIDGLIWMEGEREVADILKVVIER